MEKDCCHLTAACASQEPELHGVMQAATAAGIPWGTILIALLNSQGAKDAIAALIKLITDRVNPKDAPAA